MVGSPGPCGGRVLSLGDKSQAEGTPDGSGMRVLCPEQEDLTTVTTESPLLRTLLLEPHAASNILVTKEKPGAWTGKLKPRYPCQKLLLFKGNRN